MRLSKSAWLATLVICPIVFSSAAQAAVCSFGAADDGPTLQGVFDDIFEPGSAPDATNDCVAEGQDGTWTLGSGSQSATILLEISVQENSNVMGIYDANSNSTQLTIFNGRQSDGTTKFLTFTPAGGGYDVAVSNGITSGPSVHFDSTAIGFYLTSGGNTYYSDTALNTGADAGVDHMYAYQGNNGVFGENGVVPGEIFDPGQYILAWEETSGGGSAAGQHDYQDMVVLVRNFTPVPVPAAAWLFGSGLMMLWPAFRRRKTAIA